MSSAQALRELWGARGRELARLVAESYGVPLLVVLGRKRSKSVGVARAAVAHALRAEGWPFQRIARFLGRDHSTVIYFCRAHAWRTQAPAGVPFKAWESDRKKGDSAP